MEVLSGELCGTCRCPGLDASDSETELLAAGWKQYHVAEKAKG